ncbi:hypothetical protein NFI96_017993 [Prochilodus magdalenae]|nr:hypothetical protein NFI96_017993 [Prochilodus magdalenae]
MSRDEDHGVTAAELPQVHHAEDPLSFPYREKVGVEDAILYLLHRAHCHLDKGGGAVRVMFFDFSSAFNTIQPLLLRDKLMKMKVDMHLDTWITDTWIRSYKYLGVHLDEKLDWSVNTDTVYKKAGVLQDLPETPADVLPVCGGQRPLLCCGLLGRQYQQEGCWMTRQAGLFYEMTARVLLYLLPDGSSEESPCEG